MPLTSRAMINGQVVEEPKRRAWPALGLRATWPIGLVLLALGGLGWLSGARFTAVGVPSGLNTIFGGLFAVQLGVPIPAGWWLVGATAVCGAFFSRVEVAHRPVRYQRGAEAGARGRWQLAPASHWLAWLLVIAIDVASTFVGVTELTKAPAGVWPIFLEVARSREYNGLASLVLTFAPEWAIIAGWALVWKR